MFPVKHAILSVTPSTLRAGDGGRAYRSGEHGRRVQDGGKEGGALGSGERLRATEDGSETKRHFSRAEGRGFAGTRGSKAGEAPNEREVFFLPPAP